jgi:1,4-dihydroxy-2-naphthoate octaprenyltransferase
MKRTIKIWLLATRPKTLPASVMPVIIASALALSNKSFDYVTFALTLIESLLIQVITNFVNEIYDYKRGVDTNERTGPSRAVADGAISVKAMVAASVALTVITLILGLYLVIAKDGGLFILGIGLSSLLLAYIYTAGPKPISYLGISEIFCFLFFGVFAVLGTYYLQVHKITLEALITSLGPGFFSTNILGTNNIRDMQTDLKAGKMTLAVKIGRKKAIALYIVFNVFAFITPFILTLLIKNYWVLLPIISFPFSIYLIRNLIKYSGPELNRVLAGTGQLLIMYGTLSCVGFLL